MLNSDILIKILLTIIFGAILGLETETRTIEQKGKKVAEKEERSKIGGIRTYTVISLFGGISGLFYLEQAYVLSYTLFAAILFFTLAAYVLNVQIKKAFGLTTEIAIIITFVLGFLVTSAILPIVVSLFILVLLSFFLSQKRGLGALVHKIEHKEIIDIIKFGLVSIVILPILPDKDIFLSDVVALFTHSNLADASIPKISIINPFQIWLLVVIVSGINLLGYILGKFIGRLQGLFLIGIFGGLISSTSTTIAMAHKSKNVHKKNDNNLYAAIALISNAVSYIELIIIGAITSSLLFSESIGLMLGILSSGIIVGLILLYIHSKHNGSKHDIELEYEPFSIKPAVKFVVIVVLIQITVQVINLVHLSGLSVFITALSGAVSTTASSIAIGNLIENNGFTLQLGLAAFILMNLVNYVAKVIYSFNFGSREFAVKLTLGLFVTGIFGALGIFLL